MPGNDLASHWPRLLPHQAPTALANCRPCPRPRCPCSLHFLFDKHFAKAVQIVDHSGVFSFEGERSRRRVFQVQGHRQGDRYTVIPGHFCSCQNFYFDVVSKNEATYVSVPSWPVPLTACPGTGQIAVQIHRPPCMELHVATPVHAATAVEVNASCPFSPPPVALQCKHQLAAQLSEALGQTRNTVVGDLVVAEILQSQ